MAKVKVTTTDKNIYHVSGSVIELEQVMADHLVSKGFAIMGVQESAFKEITEKKSNKKSNK